MSSRQILTDAATRHQVFLLRYGDGQSKDARATLRRLIKDIRARLALDPTDYQQGRLQDLLKDIEAINQAAFSKIKADTMKSSVALAKSEAELSAKMFEFGTTAKFTVPADALLVAAVMGSKMNIDDLVGVSIEDALDKFSVRKSGEIMQTITDGVVIGDSSDKISESVGDLITHRQTRQSDALVRTIVSNISSSSRREIMLANTDIADEYQWISVLDGRTTLICGSRDLKKFTIGTPGNPFPPAHWNCRSTTIILVKPEFNLVSDVKIDRATVGSGGIDHVSPGTTYGGWLKTQPKEFVDKALGTERSKLFRSGKLTIDKFVDPTGEVYTLEQLRENSLALQSL